MSTNTPTPEELQAPAAAAPSNANQSARVTADDETEIDLVALFWHFLEKLHWTLLTALLCAAIAAFYVFRMATPMYSATSKIYIVGSDTAISLSDLQIGSNLAADYQEVFKNWHVHELVDQRLNLNYTYTELSNMLSVSNPANTHVLYVTIVSPNPQEAKLLADTYAQVAREFIASRMDMREPNIFEEARMPDRPVSPRKTRTVILGFIIGILLSMGVLTFRFLSDDRICSSEDIAKVGNLTTLGMIPIQSGIQQDDSTQSAGGTRGARR